MNMNLQEDIHRIQSMMGIITEDRMEKVIKSLIDSVGIQNTIKMIDDYDVINSYLTDEDKIDYIKDQFQRINDGKNFSLEQIWQRPIQLDLEDGLKRHQIEGLGDNYATIVKYKTNGGDMKYYRKYEELPSETIDKLFRMMLSQYIDI